MVVIVMNARIFEKSENEASALGGDPRPGRALFLPGAHWLARTGYGFMLLFYLVALVAVVSTFTAHPLDWRDAVGALLMILVPLVIATNLRTSAVYGSAHGLEIVRWGVRRMVPWSKVGTAEYAWWSLNHSARVARLILHEEKPRTILFFANDRVLAELEGMRDVYASR
jgi:hypothetical protein